MERAAIGGACTMRAIHACRGPDNIDGFPAVRFLMSLLTSFVDAVAAFGVVPVVFSDPLRDPSFRSKVTLAGVLLIASAVTSMCVLLDVFRYYHLWPHQPPQIVLQVRPLHACTHIPRRYLSDRRVFHPPTLLSGLEVWRFQHIRGDSDADHLECALGFQLGVRDGSSPNSRCMGCRCRQTRTLPRN